MVAAEAGMTPEEKLLRIIESPTEAKAHVALRPAFNFQASALYVKAWFKHFREKAKDYLSLKIAIRVLFAACIFSTLFLIVDFWNGLPNAALLEKMELAAKRADIGRINIEALNPLSVFQQEIGQNNMFSLPAAPLETQTQEQKSEAAPAPDVLRTMVQNFRVVGIMWSDMPQVIIEDTADGRTYFLNKGNKVKGVRIKDILKDRVVLSYNKEEIELR